MVEVKFALRTAGGLIMADTTGKTEIARQGASGENRRMLGVVADSFKTASENKIT